MKPGVDSGLPSSARVGRSVIVGTAGHIDHGKTALIYALTGIDTDRLPEEKRRGITIDLGFASMELPDQNGGVLQLSFIDVPGHHAFIRNMLAGASGIDCAMLIIAADEGVKAQTREHLAICSLLGIARGLVVLTKKDAVDADWLERTKRDAAEFLKNTFLRDAPVLAVSAKTGEGIGELRDALGKLAASVPEQDRNLVTRLFPDRAFSMRGFGTVVTGTLQSGAIRAGGTLESQPGGREVRVRGVQVHGESVREVAAPCRVALNLVGIEPGEIQRGQTLTPAGTLRTTTMVDAEISLLPDAPALKHRARVRFHAFTADVAATVLLYDHERLTAGAPAIVRLQLERPLVLLPGDRFVLRIPSPAATVGGGRVLDTTGRRRLRKANALRWLLALRNAEPEQQMQMRIERRWSMGAGIGDLMQETGLVAEKIRQTLCALARTGDVITKLAGQGQVEFAIATKPLAEAEEAMLAQLRRANNGAASRAELRSRTGLNETVFEMALGRLAQSGKIEGRDTVRLAGQIGAGEERLQKCASAIEREYLSAAIAPPLLREVMDRLKFNSTEMREAMVVLLRSQRLVRLGSDDLFIHRDAVVTLSAKLLEHRGETFDVSRFKNFTGLTRKHAIPLLELLDRSHVMRNIGGTRVVI